jgi:hypothetical protein
MNDEHEANVTTGRDKAEESTSNKSSEECAPGRTSRAIEHPQGFALNWDTEPDPVHVNVVMVRQTQIDVFAVVFGDGMNMPGRMVMEQGKRVLYAPIIASLRIPASNMEALTDAIVASWNEYVRALPSEAIGSKREYVRVPVVQAKKNDE